LQSNNYTHDNVGKLQDAVVITWILLLST